MVSKSSLKEWLSVDRLAEWVLEAGERTHDFVRDLEGEELIGPFRPMSNPFLWEMSHLTWFQEYWVLRNLFDEDPEFDDVDERYDSTRIQHEKRWVIDLIPKERAIEYKKNVVERTISRLREEPSEEVMYHVLYTVYHDDMHNEAFTYMRQTLGFSAPELGLAASDPPPSPAGANSRERDDVQVPGGTFHLGASGDEPFVFDNEKWGKEVKVEPFRISRTCVTRGEYLKFVKDDGYNRPEFWSSPGWSWRESENAEKPLYWRQNNDGRWMQRQFNRWEPLKTDLPVVHVNYYEAEAYCNWADRRLPTESEWAAAASTDPSEDGSHFRDSNRTYPWGGKFPGENLANLDWRHRGCVPVNAYPQGDSAYGCRQMIGNVWEWTSTTFEPFPGFEEDFYQQYSSPWFGSRKVLRGGSWATRSRLIRNGYRNYFTPDRRDVFAGFRTCPR